MKNLLISALFFGMLFFVGCDKDDALESETLSPVNQENLQTAQERVDLAEDELEIEISSPYTGKTIFVPKGSINAIEKAVVEAGKKGKVILEAGVHYEFNTVKIRSSVLIEGKAGARVLTRNHDPAARISPAFHIRNTANVTMRNFSLAPRGPTANTAILVEESAKFVAQYLQVKNYGIGIMLAGANGAKIVNSTFEGLGKYSGIIALKGERVVLKGNDVSKYESGIQLSDYRGTAFQNKVYHNKQSGILFTKANGFAIAGTPNLIARVAANGWVVTDNEIYQNTKDGFDLRNGAHQNYLVENLASENSRYDFNLRGKSLNPQSGSVEPTSYSNRVTTTFREHRIKDCGDDNRIIGGTIVLDRWDPCAN